MKSVICMTFLVTVACASCVPLNPPPPPSKPHSNLENYLVELTAAPGADTLKVHSGPKVCNNGKEGCMEFDENRLGTITFRFKGDQKERDCNTWPAAQWVITKIQLSDTGDAGTDKGTFSGSPPPWLVSAFPGVDETNGEIYKTTWDKASRSVTIIDLNNHDSTLGDKVIYYQVTATKCDENNPKNIDIDPSIRNRGKK